MPTSDAAARDRFLAALLQAVRDSVIFTDLDGRIRYWNEGATALFGYTEAEMMGQTPGRLYPGANSAELARDLAAVLAGRAAPRDWEGRRKDGSRVWVHITTTVVTGPDGRPAGFLGVAKDVTARREAERARREAEARYRALIERTAEGVWRLELAEPVPTSLPPDEQIAGFFAHATLAECNDSMARMYGFTSADELIGTPLGALLPADDPHNIGYLRAFIANDYHLDGAESHERDRHGAERHFLNNLLGIVEDGAMVAAWGSQRDITGLKQTELALRASEARMQFALEASALGVWELDWETGEVWRTPRHDQIFGYPSLEPAWSFERFLGHVHPDDRAPVEARMRDALARGAEFQFECRITRADGAERRIWVRGLMEPALPGARRRMLGGVQDITDKALAEQQLRQVDRLEVVGRLAGGVAHEANNQMSVILGCADFVLRRHDVPDAVRQDVEYVREAAERTAAITQQLLAFSRRQVMQLEVVDLGAALRHLAPIVERSLLPGQRLALAGGTPTLRVRVDPGQLDQVVLNLALNARDAMPAGGTLSIGADRVWLDEGYIAGKGIVSAAPGSYARLTVSDTGHGMDHATLARIFEPFFTTKGTGRGSGLGLATVYGIVKQSGGLVWAYSEPGEGTVIRVYLPEVDAPVTDAAAPTATGAGSGARVLLVEDDGMVRLTLARTLRERGCSVEEAANGREAVAILERAAEPPDAVISDVVMPEMDGAELAGVLAARWPRVPVLFTSGFADADGRLPVTDSTIHFLPKPWTPDQLLAALQQLLDAHRGAPVTA